MIELSPRARRDVQDALQAVLDRAMDAYGAEDTDAIKRHLSDLWSVTHHAHEAVSNAERETRARALAELNQRKVA